MITDKAYLNLDIKDMKGEVWEDCIGYDGLYYVSNLGRVKSEEREVKCGKGWRVKPSTIMKQQIVKGNNNNVRFDSKHLAVTFGINNKRKTYNVSELVGNAFIGKKNKKECYCKKNKIWDDCRASNLEIKTISESTKLSYQKGFCDRNKKTLNYNHEPVNMFKRLKDKKVFIGGVELRKEYGYDCQSNIRKSLLSGGLCKGSRWEIIKIKP